MIQPLTTVELRPPALVVHNAAGPVNATLTNPACWANCDGSTTTPILNVLDFTCFQNAWATAASQNSAGGPMDAPTLLHADCDHDLTPTLLDFGCFLNAFTIGCPCHTPSGSVSVTDDGSITSTAPFTLWFDCRRQVTLFTDDHQPQSWTEDIPVLLHLQSTSDWRPAMLPAPHTLDGHATR